MRFLFSSSIVIALVFCAASAEAYFKSPAQLNRNVSRERAVAISVDAPEGWPDWIGLIGVEPSYRFMPSYYYEKRDLIRATEDDDWPSWIGRIRLW